MHIQPSTLYGKGLDTRLCSGQILLRSLHQREASGKFGRVCQSIFLSFEIHNPFAYGKRGRGLGRAIEFKRRLLQHLLILTLFGFVQ